MALLGSVFVMGFLGSWHCGVMCGPLSCNFRAQKDFFSYHLGRLLSYLFISGLLFYGTQFFVNTESRVLRLSASVIFGLVFIYFGLVQLSILNNRRFLFKYYKFQFKFLEKNKAVYTKFPVVLGLLTGFFPCGWLYSFLLLSSQTRSWPMSLMLIFIFWLSSLPAFIVFNGFMQNLIKRSPVKYQIISGFVLIVAGLLAILGHWSVILHTMG